MRLCEKTCHIQIRGDGSQIRQEKTGARANSQRNEFVVSKISVFGETKPTHRRSASLPRGTEDVTSLKRATVETLSFWCPRLRFLQNGISERKGCPKQQKMTSYYRTADTQDDEPDFSVRSDPP